LARYFKSSVSLWTAYIQNVELFYVHCLFKLNPCNTSMQECQWHANCC
jgi:hypothetical protein